MKTLAEIQHASEDREIPADSLLHQWVETVLKAMNRSGTVVIRLVDEAESRELNHRYRNKNAATNVLSFPFEAPEFVQDDHLGDLVICAPVVRKEAIEQSKPLNWHWAHMVVHGMLHLLGYDHIKDDEAEIMERQEISILEKLAINNPYETEN